jgi:hypothetical protein
VSARRLYADFISSMVRVVGRPKISYDEEGLVETYLRSLMAGRKEAVVNMWLKISISKYKYRTWYFWVLTSNGFGD